MHLVTEKADNSVFNNAMYPIAYPKKERFYDHDET
jgi:hypothetical protein